MENLNNKPVLKIDRILSTQSELGPSIPDGGYGWVVLMTTLFFQIFIPSLIVGYGIIMVFLRLENNASVYPMFWDNPIIYTPLFFIATWTLIDPWIRRLIETSKWPRLVVTSGVCLTCAGLLFIWFSIANRDRKVSWFVVSGLLSGTGASLIISQCEVLITQYFKLKLKSVNVCIQLVVAIGFILTPIVLGTSIIRYGLLTPVIWYQIIILQGMIVAMFIKKPPYLKTTGNPYKLIQGTNDDEIDIFPGTNTRELQYTRSSKTEENLKTANGNDIEPGTSLADELAASALREQEEASGKSARNEHRNSSLIDIEVHATANGNPGWIQFDGDDKAEGNGEPLSSLSSRNSQKTSASGKSQDLDRIETFEDSFVQIPKPLFSDTQINNNNSYSFDTGESVSDEPVVFVPAVANKQPGFFNKHLYFLKHPSFYKSLLQIITTKYSIFMFYALFPSYLYMRITNLRIQHACFIVGYISMAHLLFASLNAFVQNSYRRKALFLWIFSWSGAIGFILITDVKSETWFTIGAIQVVISIQSLQYFGTPLLNLNRRGESNTVHLVLSTMTGLSFLMFFLIDFSYVNCFRLISFLQFVMGGVWFANFTFKKIKHLLVYRG